MMIFVYGTRTFSRKYQNALVATCGICTKRTTFHMARDQEWFTLFLIPLFPLGSDYTLFCDGCLRGVRLYGSNGRRILHLRKATRSLLNNEMTQDDYVAMIEKRKIRLDDIVPKKPPENWKCPVCKTMNHRTVKACEYCGYWN